MRRDAAVGIVGVRVVGDVIVTGILALQVGQVVGGIVGEGRGRDLVGAGQVAVTGDGFDDVVGVVGEIGAQRRLARAAEFQPGEVVGGVVGRSQHAAVGVRHFRAISDRIIGERQRLGVHILDHGDAIQCIVGHGVQADAVAGGQLVAIGVVGVRDRLDGGATGVFPDRHGEPVGGVEGEFLLST